MELLTISSKIPAVQLHADCIVGYIHQHETVYHTNTIEGYPLRVCERLLSSQQLKQFPESNGSISPLKL